MWYNYFMKKLPHPLLLIILIGTFLYWRSLSFDYTNFDDNSLIQENQNYISNISNIPDAFTKTVFITGSDVFYRPMETIWFILNAQMAGSEWKELPPVFHASSLLLHFLAVYLIFILMKRFGNSNDASLFLSLIFLVHPVLVQSVAWVPGVVDILVTVFSISAFLSFLDFINTQKRKHFVLHILFFALALYTKEIAVGMIIVCLLYLHLIQKEKLFSYNKKVFLIGWFVIAAIWLMMRDSALQNQPRKEIVEMISSVVFNFPACVQYVGKILLPFNLSVMPVMADTAFVYGIASLALFAAISFISKEKRKNRILFTVSWFIVFLLPTFIKTSEFRIHQFYEHRMYLPMVGVLLFFAETKFFSRSPILPFSDSETEKRRNGERWKRWAAIIVILFFFILSFRHQTVFSDTKSFLDNAVSTSPGSSLAHRNRGIYFQDKNLLHEAAAEYKKSLALNPNDKDLHNNMGVIYDTWKQKDLAEKEYLAETKMNPANSQAFHNLGVLYSEKNENEKAEMYLKKAINIYPVESSYQQLALLYKKTGRKKEFEEIAMKIQQANGKTVPVNATVSSEHPVSAAEAEHALLTALAADSLNKETLFNLGLLYYRNERKPEAEKMWRKSVRIDSTYTDAYNNLAICLAQQGKNSEAESVMKKLISSNPDYVDGYFNLANFYARNGKEKDALVYVTELKKRGITKEQFQQRGIKLSAELEKVFDK